jgi:replicative DNA helicase
VATNESLVINSVLKNKDIGTLYAQSADDLFDSYRDVWEGIKTYHQKYHTVPDVDVIMDRYPDFEEAEVSGDSAYYMERLKTEYIHTKMERMLRGAGKDLTLDSAPEILNKLQEKLATLNKFSHAARDTNIMDFDEAERHYDEVRKKAEAMGGTPGIPTGISFIDSAYTSGLAGGDLVVVLGWTGRGKSLLTTLIACHAHDMGLKPMIVSLEMSGDKLRDRVWTIKGSGLFQNSALSLGEIDVDNMRDFRTKQAGKQEFIVVNNDGVQELSPNVVRAKIDQHKPDLVIFDYAQLGTDNANSADMTPRMRNMSKEYKRLGVAADIPVILISSATPDGSAASDMPPMIEQVAWSKQLAYDADLAFAVHKHDESNMIQVACRKNRNGPLFGGFLDWDIDNGIYKEVYDA